MTIRSEPLPEHNNSEFNKTLLSPPVSLSNFPERLSLNSKLVHLNNPSKYAIIIYKAIYASLNSDWWQALDSTITQYGYKNKLATFLEWLNTHSITISNRFNILNEYQEKRVNIDGVKPQSVSISIIFSFLSEGAENSNLNSEESYFLSLLYDSTTISKPEDKIPYTLTGWFSQMDWLKNIISDKDWLALESPKRLMESFSVTVAATLLWILKNKKDISQCVNISQALKTGDNVKYKRTKLFKYSRDLLYQINNKKLSNSHFELLMSDTIKPNAHKKIRHLLTKRSAIPLKSVINKKREEHFREPHIFSAETIETTGLMEQQLAAWLCAWMTVQPTDIKKLKRRDFLINYNRNNRPVLMQCLYYKGRSDKENDIPLLDMTQIETKALYAYINTLPSDSESLFTSSATSVKHFTPSSTNPLISRLTALWKLPSLDRYIKHQLSLRKSSDLFRRVYLKVVNNCSVDYHEWERYAEKNNQSRDIITYRLDVPRPVPMLIFGLNNIKTSAVYSRSDQYREEDLIPHNSHTPTTEKINYLTDKNKEWVNQNGRITRIVLDDIANHAYQPNLNVALALAREKRLQSIVKKASGTEEKIKINNLGTITTPSVDESLLNEEPDHVIVLDSPETVVNFLHYIAESERLTSLLLEHAPVFFEQTVLPTAEWMESLLNDGISLASIKEGKQQYSNLCKVLPPLFTSQLAGGVG